MKRYRLLKDLPGWKAGKEFNYRGLVDFLYLRVVNFEEAEWFEEVKEEKPESRKDKLHKILVENFQHAKPSIKKCEYSLKYWSAVEAIEELYTQPKPTLDVEELANILGSTFKGGPYQWIEVAQASIFWLKSKDNK